MLRHKPPITMSNVPEQQSHTTDHISLRGSILHCRSQNQTGAQLLFYFILV